MNSRRYLVAVAAALVLLPALILPGCNSSKKTTTADRYASADTASLELALSQTQAAAGVAINAADSSASHKKKSGRLDIERDSAGRPVRLTWWACSSASARSAHASVTDLAGDVAFASARLSRTSSDESARESETEKQTRPALSGLPAAGYAFFLLALIVISLRIWTATRKR